MSSNRRVETGNQGLICPQHLRPICPPLNPLECELFLAEISDVTAYFLCAFTACLKPRDYSRRPGRMETGVWCSPGLVEYSPPFLLRHLTYATSCRTNDLITSAAL